MKAKIFRIIILAWNIFPFKKLLSELIKKSSYLKLKLYKDLRYRGNFVVKVNKSTLTLFNSGYTTIENEIFWNGIEQGWEKISLKIWAHFCANSKYIYDVGANTGIYSLIAATQNKNSIVHSFEPVKRTNTIFRKNIALNNFKNIELHEIAVSNKTGTALFYDADTTSQYSASLNEEMITDESLKIQYEVNIQRLDHFSKLNGNRIDLIKIDVEMHEVEVLKGMGELITNSRPIILIEILNDEIGLKIESFFKDLNYIYFDIDENSFPTMKDHLVKSEYYNYLILPIEKLNEYNKINFTNVIQ